MWHSCGNIKYVKGLSPQPDTGWHLSKKMILFKLFAEGLHCHRLYTTQFQMNGRTSVFAATPNLFWMTPYSISIYHTFTKSCNILPCHKEDIVTSSITLLRWLLYLPFLVGVNMLKVIFPLIIHSLHHLPELFFFSAAKNITLIKFCAV